MRREATTGIVCHVRIDGEAKVQKAAYRHTLSSILSILLLLSLCRLIPAVSQRGTGPTSSFVCSGMWDVLTGRLFIDSEQLRVSPLRLFLS